MSGLSQLTARAFSSSPPKVLGYPFNSWSLSKLVGVIGDSDMLGSKTISDECVRLILDGYGISYQRTKNWKESNAPELEEKKAHREAEGERQEGTRRLLLLLSLERLQGRKGQSWRG